jgi:hypothetical protein
MEETSSIGVKGRKKVTEWFVVATGLGVRVRVRRDAGCWVNQ